MEAKLSPRIGILFLLVAASCFAANHLSARIAFDHGASVAAAVVVRASATALFLFVLMKAQGIVIAVPRPLRGKAFLAGLLIASQSYCLYSAVALIPPALALLVFQTSPMLYVLLSWTLGVEKPRLSALPSMLLGLVGLGLALNLDPTRLDVRLAEIGAGVAWAFASALSMAAVYYLNANALKPMDGRLRTFAMVTVTAAVLLAGGASAGALALPRDGAGWAGIVLLAGFYCAAVSLLFWVLPKVPSTSTAALNFEPIALLALAFLILGHTVTPLQILGAVLTVAAIVWLGLSKK